MIFHYSDILLVGKLVIRLIVIVEKLVIDEEPLSCMLVDLQTVSNSRQMCRKLKAMILQYAKLVCSTVLTGEKQPLRHALASNLLSR